MAQSLIRLVAIGLATACAACSSTTQSSSDASPTPAPWPPAIGAQYILGGGAEQIACYDSSATLDKVADAVSKHDDEGFQQLSADAATEPGGTTVRVLGYNILNGYLDLRIRTGNDAGRECWYIVGNDNVVGGHPFLKRRLPDNGASS